MWALKRYRCLEQSKTMLASLLNGTDMNSEIQKRSKEFWCAFRRSPIINCAISIHITAVIIANIILFIALIKLLPIIDARAEARSFILAVVLLIATSFNLIAVEVNWLFSRKNGDVKFKCIILPCFMAFIAMVFISLSDIQVGRKSLVSMCQSLIFVPLILCFAKSRVNGVILGKNMNNPKSQR